MPPKTKNICKKILHNPFFIALMLTVLAMIIIVAVFKNSNYGGASNIFKSGFYMFIAFSLILLLNNMFLKRTMESTQIKTEVKEVFTGIDMSKEMSHDIIQIEPNLYEENYETYKEKKNGGSIIYSDDNANNTNDNDINDNDTNSNTNNDTNNNTNNNTNSNTNDNTNDNTNINTNSNSNTNTNDTNNIAVSEALPETIPETILIPNDVNSILDSIVKIET